MRIISKTLLALFLMLSTCTRTTVYAQPQIDSFVDGDTLWVIENGIKEKIRFYCTDTPETKFGRQVYGDVEIGKLASEHLKEKLKVGDAVEIACKGKDWTRKREVCIIFKGDRNINLEMIQDGYAYVDTEYCKESKYLKAQLEAQRLKKGLWELGEWQNPKEYRKCVRSGKCKR